MNLQQKLHYAQSEMLDKGLEIAIAVQEIISAVDTSRRNHGVDRDVSSRRALAKSRSSANPCRTSVRIKSPIA